MSRLPEFHFYISLHEILIIDTVKKSRTEGDGADRYFWRGFEKLFDSIFRKLSKLRLENSSRAPNQDLTLIGSASIAEFSLKMSFFPHKFDFLSEISLNFSSTIDFPSENSIEEPQLWPWGAPGSFEDTFNPCPNPASSPIQHPIKPQLSPLPSNLQTSKIPLNFSSII